MTEPTPPDGHQPAEPPRFGEAPAPQEYTGEDDVVDATPPRTQRPEGAGLDAASRSTLDHSTPASPPPPADPTAAFAASPPPPAQPPAQPAGPPASPPHPSAQPAGNAPPPGPYAAAAAASPPPQGYPPATATGPGAGAPPPGGPGAGGPPPGFGAAPEPKKKKSGLLVGGLIALIVALLGGLGFVLLQGGDDTTADDPPDTREEDEEEEEDEPEVTDPPVTDPPVTEPPVTDPPVTDPPVTDPPEPDGSVQNIFVRVEAFDALVADEDLTPTFQELATREGDNPVATTDDVINLCAAMPLDADVNASVEWVRDGTTVLAGDPIDLFAPGDGACLNNSGDPLVAGSYEVSFTDAAGAMSGVALFTVGSETVTQTFVNDTGVEVCSVDAGPTPAGFYQTFELASGASLPVGDSILFDVAAVEHEARAVDCDDNPLESFFFTPSGEDVNLSTGELTNPPPADISDLEFVALDGEIGSLDLAVTSPDDVAEVLDILLTAEDRLRIATTDTALTLCVGWDVPGALEADIVWEFNRVEVARIPAVAEDGRIGGCVPPGGAEFDEGAYQAYLSRGELISTVETYTVGREETQLAFVNDTGVEICEVGFSPTLTNFYTFFVFAESSEFEGALAPGDSFTIVAPFIESDIRGRDCEGNNVSEAFGIPPTDQVLNLTDGQP